MYRLTLADKRSKHARSHTLAHAHTRTHLIWGMFNLKHSLFFPLKDWSSIPWYRWKNMAACVRMGLCEKCKVSNWFGVLYRSCIFLCVWIMFIWHALMCVCYVRCFTSPFIFSDFIPFSPPLFTLIPLTVVIPSKNTETISNCKHIFQIQSHCMINHIHMCLFCAR